MSHLTPYAQNILSSAASFGMPAPAATTVSETETIADLQRETAKLQAEADGAKKRAARRHQEMMHSNRRAERAEDALDRETKERKAQEDKNYKLQYSYTHTIHDLRAKIESQILDSQKESKQAQLKIVAETEERLRKQFEGEVIATRTQFHAALQATNNEVKELRKLLQQNQQSIAWHKMQSQQPVAQREATQTSKTTADIQADVPLQQQQGATASVAAGDKKRRRQNSTGYVVARIQITRLACLTTTPEMLILLVQSPSEGVLLQQRRGHQTLRLKRTLQPHHVRHVGQTNRHISPRLLPSRWERLSPVKTRLSGPLLRHPSHHESKRRYLAHLHQAAQLALSKPSRC